MNVRLGYGLILTLALFGSGPAIAQTTSDVQFTAGTSGATISGSVTGRDYLDYRLGASAGQMMTASIKATATDGHGIVYFNILPPGSDGVAIFNSSMSADNAGSVELPEDGTYTIRVYLMGNDRDTGKTVGFALPVSIE